MDTVIIPVPETFPKVWWSKETWEEFKALCDQEDKRITSLILYGE